MELPKWPAVKQQQPVLSAYRSLVTLYVLDIQSVFDQ